MTRFAPASEHFACAFDRADPAADLARQATCEICATSAEFSPWRIAASRSMSCTSGKREKLLDPVFEIVECQAKFLALHKLDDAAAHQINRRNQHGSLTGTPAATSSSFSDRALETPKWKMLAASAASAFRAREHIGKVRHRSRASRGNHRNADRLAHCRCKFAVKSRTRAVRIHRCEQNLAGAARLGFARPFHDTPARGLASALHEDLRIAHWISGFRIAPRINRDHHGLRAEAAANGADQRRIGKSRGVDADLVRAGFKHLLRVVCAANPAAHGRTERTARAPCAAPYPAASAALHGSP